MTAPPPEGHALAPARPRLSAAMTSEDVLPAPPSLRLPRWAGGSDIPSTRVLAPADLVVFAVVSLVWVAANVQFWAWWGPRALAGTTWLAVPVSAALAYQTVVLPTIFWSFVARMRRPEKRTADVGTRVAVITLCVPSCESIDVIERQLRAIAAIDYPHDSWILDEEDSSEVRALAEKHGVRHFSRSGVPRWNQPGPPLQRATKAGNVNAWLEHLTALGVEYDVFVQMDIDHRPQQSYLDRVLGYFDDPGVAWVQAPSVGIGNLSTWTARGLAEQDLVFQGPLQMGFYGATGTPFIVGSHTTYRMDAIRRIGGFQPTRAEDHLDTVVLAANGYRGVYLPEIIAVGDGPDDFPTYLRQQFAWASSMITVFFEWTPRLLRRYTPAQAVQFLFCQSWYLLWAITLLILWLAPPVALLVDRPIAENATLGAYVLYALPPFLVGWVMWCVARPSFQPRGIGISWRGAVLTVARWPVVLWALVSVLLRMKHPYMITPKPGRTGVARPRARALVVYGPLVALGTLPVLAVWVADVLSGTGGLQPYVPLTLLNALVPILALGIALGLELRDTRRLTPVRDTLVGRAGTLGLLTVAASSWAVTAVIHWAAVESVIR